MLDKLLKKKKEKRKVPKHLAVSVDGNLKWAEKHGKTIDEAMKICFKNIHNLFTYQVENNIPIITIHLLTAELTSSEHYNKIVEYVTDYLKSLTKSELVHKNKIKVSILGKWYNLPGNLVEAIRGIIDETKDYDYFFFNLCLNYNGQEEIVDACKLIARKVQANKMSPIDVNKETIKDNLYSSYYLPPDLIIATGKTYSTKAFLLWDSAYARIYFANTLWPDFEKDNFYKALDFFQNM